jgi:hypothetical protein
LPPPPRPGLRLRVVEQWPHGERRGAVLRDGFAQDFPPCPSPLWSGYLGHVAHCQQCMPIAHVCEAHFVYQTPLPTCAQHVSLHTSSGCTALTHRMACVCMISWVRVSHLVPFVLCVPCLVCALPNRVQVAQCIPYHATLACVCLAAVASRAAATPVATMGALSTPPVPQGWIKARPDGSPGLLTHTSCMPLV